MSSNSNSNLSKLGSQLLSKSSSKSLNKINSKLNQPESQRNSKENLNKGNSPRVSKLNKLGSNAELGSSSNLNASANSTASASASPRSSNTKSSKSNILESQASEQVTNSTTEEPPVSQGEALEIPTETDAEPETLVTNTTEDGFVGENSSIVANKQLSRQDSTNENFEILKCVPFSGDEFETLNDNFEVTTVTERILSSPLPSTKDAFIFVNVDYEVDPDTPVIKVVTALSRSTSWEGGIDKVVTEDLVLVARPVTPILRPTTPEIKIHKEEGDEEISTDKVEHIHGSIILPPPTDQIDREAVIAEIKQISEVKEKLYLRNLMYQNLLGEYFRKKRTDEARDGEKSVTDQEKRYANCMSALLELGKEYEGNNSTNQANVNEYKLKLQERIDEAVSKSSEFTKFKRQTAIQAENSRTGKPIPVKLIDQLEGTEQRKEAEVVAVRLENIKLRNKLRRDEQLLRQKEELADGLHLIDFEQLKIENQTFNEKIEERNEELLKLRKKITNIVQVLTHVKEKLQFVQAENVELKSNLSELDTQVSKERDNLPTLKQQRDKLRMQNLNLKQKNGLLGNVPLLIDFEKKVDESKLLNDKIDNLRFLHQQLAAESISIKRKIHKAQLIN
ncbi:Coiled-coil domain-containing protein 96 [Clydaea vesicula]|uniref:Coiled-coil domain-containing protein 96 n=1 Tax=Clydaea vesicula TaxID=447962 RepID=A0AAD5UAA0_9FUNG|nr:Coiled-coil domain-containing protein 96 [Clydaea vesicula]